MEGWRWKGCDFVLNGIFMLISFYTELIVFCESLFCKHKMTVLGFPMCVFLIALFILVPVFAVYTGLLPTDNELSCCS